MAIAEKKAHKPGKTAGKTVDHAFARTLKTFQTASGREGKFFSLPELAKQYPNIHKLPVSIRIVLESVLRNCDGKKVTPEHVAQLANWQPNAERVDEIPFIVARVVLQDFSACRSWPTWPRCARWPPAWARTRS